MRTANHTTYAENIRFEEESEQFCLRAIRDIYGVDATCKKVTDKDQQLKGIDYIVTLADGSVRKVDVKVRRLSRLPWKRPEDQDILIEFVQGRGPGWAVSPISETDDVLFVWPDLYGKPGFEYAVMIPHIGCKGIVEKKEVLKRKGLLSENKAFNGHVWAQFCLVKLADLWSGKVADCL